MPETLRLDEEKHEYWLGKRKFVSVTQVIQCLGLATDYSNVSNFYRDRGRAVHKCVELVDKATLDDSTVDPILKPYTSAYKRFIRESGYVPLYWEFPGYSETLNFAGTIDKVGRLHGRTGILDIKTSSAIDPALELQLSAYEVLWNEKHPEDTCQWKYGLQLTDEGPDGKYNLITKYSKSPMGLWLSIMDVYQWKLKHRRI